MKNSLLIILLFCSIAANAQFVTGQKLIVANLDLGTSESSYTTGDKSGSGYVATSISLLRFSNPTLLKGFGAGYSYSDSHSNSLNLYYQNNINAFYAVTKLQPLAKRFYLTYGGRATGGYNFGKQSNAPTNYSTEKGFIISASGTLGLLYQLNQRLIITGELSNLLTLQYSHGINDNYVVSPAGVATKVSNTTGNTVQLNSGLRSFNLGNFSFGVSYLLK